MQGTIEPLRLLILGGTTEANVLAQAIAQDHALAPILSLAGRTGHPKASPIPTRIGGFGGIEGLRDYLATSRTGAVIDATHPFAARISINAARACDMLGLPRAIYTRAPWREETDDQWIEVEDLAEAAHALGSVPRRVLLTTGRLDLEPFRAAPRHHYLIRTIDRPDPGDLPPAHELILARGPFSTKQEIALMRDHRIEVLVTKNSGGGASFGKIAAARALGLPVVIVRRPVMATGPVFTALADVLGWIAAHRDPP